MLSEMEKKKKKQLQISLHANFQVFILKEGFFMDARN